MKKLAVLLFLNLLLMVSFWSSSLSDVGVPACATTGTVTSGTPLSHYGGRYITSRHAFFQRKQTNSSIFIGNSDGATLWAYLHIE